MVQYSVKKLARLAGVSVRTLHLYDQLGLLKPSVRTEARYRLYGETELLRLQQILFYKELDIPLKEIGAILDDPDFDLVQALQSHKLALQARHNRITALLATIDKTIVKLKTNAMLQPEELYEGLPKEKMEAYRREASQKWGAETVEKSEQALMQRGKADFENLKKESQEIWLTLAGMVTQNPASAAVQAQIARHYACIRQFWGTAHQPESQAEAYKGLGELYVHDGRYTTLDGKPNPAFALFLSQAMSHFADTQLK